MSRGQTVAIRCGPVNFEMPIKQPFGESAVGYLKIKFRGNARTEKYMYL